VVDNTLYQTLVGSLLYLTHTWSDLSYAVGAVSRYMKESHELHWKVSKRIIRYVQGTTDYGINYAVGFALNLISFANSDWSSNSTNHNSTSRYMIILGSNTICWSRKKQSAFSLSFAEVDYRGAVNVTIQELWLQNFLTKIGI
jgi:hypothetical protein